MTLTPGIRQRPTLPVTPSSDLLPDATSNCSNYSIKTPPSPNPSIKTYLTLGVSCQFPSFNIPPTLPPTQPSRHEDLEEAITS